MKKIELMNNTQAREEKLLTEIADSVEALTQLDNDYTRCYMSFLALPDSSVQDKQFWIRNAIRALFAHVEATIGGLKRLSYHRHVVKGDILSPVEIAAVQEFGYEIKENGDVREREQKIRTLNNVRFAFKAITKAYSIEWSPDFSSTGWKDFKETTDIRDRVTHPRSAVDINITPSEINTINRAQAWWRSSLSMLFSKLKESPKSS